MSQNGELYNNGAESNPGKDNEGSACVKGPPGPVGPPGPQVRHKPNSNSLICLMTNKCDKLY